MEMTPRNRSSFSFFSLSSFFFAEIFIADGARVELSRFFDFWNGFIIIILERVYRLIESPVEILIILL